ncbi:MAG: lipoprotein [Holosporaceae bacterium]|jgi:predicted small lipoprotein YifL|nr:lipoprotein [Holosporaceae bacterium]
MKYIPLLLLVCLELASCGRRGPLEPYEKEDVPYPRQYPSPEMKP